MSTSELWYIAGASRSGTSLLGGLLATATGAFNAGELHLLWRSMTDGRVCTCGTPVLSCPVWSEVRARVERRMGLDLATIQAIDRSGIRERSFLRRRDLPELDRRLLELRTQTELALSGLLDTRSLIDSSKSASTAWLALALERPIHLVHVVRDPRAVAFSKSRPHADPSMAGRPMPAGGALASSFQWLVVNAAIERLQRQSRTEATSVRYEDLALAPEETLSQLTGEPSPPQPLAFSALDSHAIGGNPGRFMHDQQISVDTRWQTGMSVTAKTTVAALTLLPRHRYGYFHGNWIAGSRAR